MSSGIGRYTRGFLGALKSCGPVRLRVITTSASCALFAYADDIRVANVPIYTLAEQLAVPRAAAGAALLHVPHYNIPLAHRGTLLVSIHDLTHLLDAGFRHSWKTRLYGRPMLRSAARNAAHIFTVSEYSKAQIVNHLDVAPDKVTVAYNGVSDEFRPIPPGTARACMHQRFGVDEPYLLYVGNLKPHKNVPALLRAFAHSSRLQRDFRLLIVGDDATGRTSLQGMAKQLGIAQRTTFLPFVEPRDLPALYSAAAVVVQPSREEGFGLPVIEAMACGTPVVCSHAASLPEVAANAARYFDPLRPDELCEVLERVVGSPALQSEMRCAGLDRAACFTWRDCAQRHYEIYRRFC